jgi:hypothetical protein
MPEPASALAKRLDDAVASAQATVQKGGRFSASAEFRARVEERLKNVETELGDLKTRLNGLYFMVISTVLAQVLLKVVAS